MNTQQPSEYDTNRHVDDDDVVALLDSTSVASSWGEHLAGCAPCSARVTRLTAAAAVLRAGYQATPVPAKILELPDLPTPRITSASRPRGHWRGIAAGFLVLTAIGVAAAAPIGRFISHIVASPPPAITPLPHVAVTPDRTDTASIAFGVSAGRITLDFASPPATLRARLGSGDTLRLDVTSTTPLNAARGEPTLVALPAGIRIMNAPEVRATYEVVVPAMTQELRVYSAGREVTVVRRTQLSATARAIPLDAARRVPE